MKSKQEILESGLLELYVLGMLSEEEKTELGVYLEAYPDLKQHIANIEDTMEQIAREHAIEPPAHVRQSVLEGTNHKTTKGRRLQNLSKSLLTFIAAASFIGCLFLGYCNKQMATENEVLSNRLTEQRADCQKLLSKYKDDEALIAFLKHSDTREIALSGQFNNINHSAEVFWNGTAQKAYLNIFNLPKPQPGMDYQLWADIDGKMVDMGLIKLDSEGLLEIPYMQKAASLNVTLEKAGGNDHPTVSRIVLNGQV